MGRRWNTLLKGSLVALATLSVVSANSQVGISAESLIRRRILSDLKQAQEAAGIFVDDAYLFEDTVENRGRRLQQSATDVANTIANPTILSAIANLFLNGSVVGGFPGAELNLPGGSSAGYSPTNSSYCLFSTSPRNASANRGPIAAPPGGLPESFSCVEGSTAGANEFVVSYDSKTYVCRGAPAGGSGRKLMQTAQSPALAALASERTANAFFETTLNAIGLPVWNCIVATHPGGNTTFGQSTLAVLNDLGVVAQHFLTWLNSNGQLTYQEDLKNDFVSLTNPLWPGGPRFNFSIDFEQFAAKREQIRSIFGFPAPPSPPPPAPVRVNSEVPATPTTGGTVPSGSTPSNTGSSNAQSSENNQQSGSQATSGSPAVSTQQTASPPSTDTPVATLPPTPPAEASLTVFDGYLSNCQVVLGSAPGGDGNFNRNNDFQAVVIDGRTSMSLNATTLYNGSVSYIIPASKTVEYAPLTQATRSTAQYCYDIATLQPVHNPIASLVIADAPGMAGNAITTLAIFGQSYGTTPASIATALGLSLPDNTTLFTYNALGQAINGSAQALSFLKINSEVTNLVTAGANLLTNDSSVYASYAIILNQAIARKISYSPPLTQTTASAPSQGRKLLQAAATAAVDLTNATTVTDILQIAQQIASGSSDATLRSTVSPDLTQEELVAVATAVANLNAATAASTDVVTTQLSQLYGQTTLASAVDALERGEISPQDFASATDSTAVNRALTGVLPGTLLPVTASAPSRSVTPQTQSSSSQTTSSSSSGLSHGGKVALATIFPIVGVIAIVLAVAFFVRKNRSESTSGNVWYRRPFARNHASQPAV